MLVVMRFDVPADAAQEFLEHARSALAAFAVRPGYVQGHLGRAPDEDSAWVLSTEWTGVGAYRRSLSPYDVKVALAPLLGYSRDEVSAFELVASEPPRPSSGTAAGRP